MNQLIITDLRVEQFRKFAKPVRLAGLGPGLNLLCAANEAGKSTLKAALDAAFFTRHRVGGEAARSLRTQDNDAPPVVQVSFALGGDAFTLTKRFHRQHRARLIRPGGSLAEGDAAEEELQALLGFETVGARASAKAEALGVWGLLWVAQGDSFAPLQVSASARGSLEECLAGGEVATITGGARGHRVVETVRAELAKYLTQGRQQPTGRFAQVIQQEKDVQAGLAEAQALKTDLEEQLRALDETRRERAAQTRDFDPAAEEQEIQALRQQLAEAQRQAAQTDNAKLNRDLAKGNLTQADEAIARRSSLVQAAGDAATALSGAETGHKAHAEAATAAAARVAAAEQAFVQADEAWKQARDRATAHADRQKSQRVKTDSAETIARLEQALAAARRASALAKEAEALPVTGKALQKLRTLAGQRETAAAARAAAATVLRFSLSDAGAGAIRLNGGPPPVSGDTALTQPATLDLGVFGQIEVRPGTQDAAAIDQTLADAAKALADALQDLQCASLAQAEEQAERRRHLLQEVASATEKANLYAPGLNGDSGRIVGALEAAKAAADSADEAFAASAAVHGEAMSDEGVAEALQIAEDARQHQSEVRAGERQAHALAEQSARQSAAALQAAKTSHAAAAQALDLARKAAGDDVLAAQIPAAADALSAAEAQYETALEKSRTTGTPDSIQKQINRRETSRENRRNRIAKLGETIASLEAQVRAKSERGPDEAIAIAEESLTRLAIERERIERDVAALQLLDRTLREAQASVEARYLEPVTQKLRPHLATLFGEAQVSMAGDFSLQTLERTQRTEDIGQLSAGTQEQLAILSRLAFAEVLAEQGRPVVLLLDDALVYADDRRIQDMFSALERAAERFQVIVLSCRERVFDGLGGATQRRLSIEPCEPIEV
jgi:DNA repair exonuclease SbcCD ATPase subunit